MSVVPIGRDIYLVANFKETQTGRMGPGQRSRSTSTCCPGQTIKGTVDSLAPGTGAQFALLPPENATGNFTKIVQRVPVKIVLDPADPHDRAAAAGPVGHATVDTRARLPARSRSLEPAAEPGAR